jgi:hypothetical protein
VTPLIPLIITIALLMTLAALVPRRNRLFVALGPAAGVSLALTALAWVT